MVTSATRPGGDARPELRHLIVPRTARYATLGGDGPDVRELWIACHGYAELAADFIGGLGAIAAPHRRIVAPEALSRFYVEEKIGPHGQESRVGATWMTREDRLTEIDDYVRYLDRLHEHLSRGMTGGVAGPPRLVALGYSQGAATISRCVLISRDITTFSRNAATARKMIGTINPMPRRPRISSRLEAE